MPQVFPTTQTAYGLPTRQDLDGYVLCINCLQPHFRKYHRARRQSNRLQDYFRHMAPSSGPISVVQGIVQKLLLGQARRPFCLTPALSFVAQPVYSNGFHGHDSPSMGLFKKKQDCKCTSECLSSNKKTILVSTFFAQAFPGVP